MGEQIAMIEILTEFLPKIYYCTNVLQIHPSTIHLSFANKSKTKYQLKYCGKKLYIQSFGIPEFQINISFVEDT